MKTTLIAITLLLASTLSAQEATITAPEQITKARIVVLNVTEDFIDCQCARITLGYRTAAGVLLPEHNRVIEVGGAANLAQANAYLTARGTARANETGSAMRRTQFRILGFLADQGIISGVTVAP